MRCILRLLAIAWAIAAVSTPCYAQQWGTTLAIPYPVVNGDCIVGSNNQAIWGSCSGTSAVPGSQFITSGTTFTTPSTITSNTRFEFILLAGGGGGGGMNTASTKAGAGNAGSTCIVDISGLSASTGYTISIGAAGTAGAATPSNGGTGGNTTLTIGGTTYQATGGNGGVTAVNTGNTANAADANCTIDVPGQIGGASSNSNVSGTAGAGGSTAYGGGGPGWGGAVAASAGQACTGYGSGGGGGTGASEAGAVGCPGAIYIKWWD